MKLIRVATSQQLADILTKPHHFPQWQACNAVHRGNVQLCKKIITTTKGTFVFKFVPKRGCFCQGYQVELRQPSRGVCRRLEEPRSKLDIDLTPGEYESRDVPRDSDQRLRFRGLTAHGRPRRELCISTDAVYLSRP